MKKKEVITMTVFSGTITTLILMWQGADDLLLAVVTFVIVMCLIYFTFNEGSR